MPGCYMLVGGGCMPGCYMLAGCLAIDRDSEIQGVQAVTVRTMSNVVTSTFTT